MDFSNIKDNTQIKCKKNNEKIKTPESPKLKVFKIPDDIFDEDEDLLDF